tara:strand:+ start:5806 stop:7980 length:2175 start_codon:yes stop_codon:yes gene_type:complete
MTKKKYHPFSEQIVDILVRKVNNDNRHFFRILVGYYLSKVASMMRCNIQTNDRDVIPVNTYVLNLMVSGTGKGHSTNILEREFVSHFKKEFLNSVFPRKAEENIEVLAQERAQARITSGQSILPLTEEYAIQKDRFTHHFDRLGELAFSFDSGTSPAVKQMREKLLLASAGSMNLELDEVGSNMSANVDVLNTFLELYDIGLIKQKLIKNTPENIRSEELPGNTPTNLMMFGTPTKLLDGGRVEDEFKQFLETGYARRLLFGYTVDSHRTQYASAEERYAEMVDINLATSIHTIQTAFSNFAKRPFNPVLQMSKDNSIYLIKYQMKCEATADQFKDHMALHKAEMSHRHYKSLKLAGAYAYADNSPDVTQDHLDYAISVVEDSGEAFHLLMRKQGPYERLAHYLADCDNEVTQHELIEELPFYKGSESQRKDLMTLAMSFGYKNNIIIKRRAIDDIEFFIGETLIETSLDKLTTSISKDIAHDYVLEHPPFDKLHKLTTADGYHYAAHAFINGHRKSENAIAGFDLLILDCDGDVSISTVKVLLEDYNFLISTTKRHTPELNRFRLILPLSHKLKLSSDEYSRFMTNVFEWLPFPVDEAAKDIARKWASHPGHYEYNQGSVIDATMFIPETKRSDETKAQISAAGMNNIERWFRTHTSQGNRANHLYRYGMVMIDSGMHLGEIVEKLESFNHSLAVPLPEDQFMNSTVKSISKELTKRGLIDEQ